MASAIFGWRFIRIEKAPAALAVPPVPTAQAAPPKNQEPEPARQEISYGSAGYDELFGFLRGKPAGDVLAALGEIAKTRPELAIDLADALGRTEEERTSWVIDVMKQWSERDPNASLLWVMQNGARVSELARGTLPGVVLDAMAARDPKALLGFVDRLLRAGYDQNQSSGIPPAIAVHLGLEALIKRGQLDAARAAVESWAHDPRVAKIGASAFEIVAAAMGKSAPQDAGTWLKALPVSEDRNAALGTYATTWAGTDPAAAMHWAETLSPADGQPAVIRETFSEWIQADADGATKWLADYVTREPPSPDDDYLIGALVSYSPAVKSKPDLAVKLLDSISDPTKRELYEERIVLSWGHRDPAAATDYVWKSPTIPQAQKLLLVQRMQTDEGDE
ncbi:MAG TPA: hypothetical protein VFB27_14085 [Opitutaceae bacterium]|nr:hypothetical protein [Opitutaceae bacterium]